MSDVGDIFVRLYTLPPGINGLTILDSDGNYNVYINSQLPQHKHAEVYRHELKHIQNNDFYNTKPIRDVEKF